LSIAPTGSATASVGAGLDLPVGTLTLGGIGKRSGTWGSTTATLATYHDNTYFAATTGYLSVSTDTRSTPTVSIWPTASAITFGQTLVSSTLSGGSASVAGSFAFTAPSTAPSAGTASQSVTFIPTDLSTYTIVVGSTSVSVNKANPVVTTWPTATAITYGQTLATSTLSGGSASPAGSFSFATPSTAPTAGTAPQSVAYTPTDTANYNTASSTVSVTVNPKVLTVTGMTANDKIYDGNTSAALETASAALVGKVTGDNVSLNTAGVAGVFSDPDAGTGKTVLVSGLSLSGTAAGNYTLTQPKLTASITPASPGDINDGLSVWIVENAGSNYLAMRFKRYKNAAAMGLQYLPKVSADKQTWFSDSFNILDQSVVSFDTQFDWVTVRDLTPITPWAPRFIQLVVQW